PAVLDAALAIAGPERHRDPRWAVTRAPLLEEAGRVAAVREPFERQGPTGEVWDRDRSDPRHVIDDLRLREPARVERLVEVAETDAPTVDVDVDLVGHRSTYADFLARRFFDGAGSAATSSPFDEGCRPRACFAAFTLASSAAIKSTTLGFSTA